MLIFSSSEVEKSYSARRIRAKIMPGPPFALIMPIAASVSGRVVLSVIRRFPAPLKMEMSLKSSRSRPMNHKFPEDGDG